MQSSLTHTLFSHAHTTAPSPVLSRITPPSPVAVLSAPSPVLSRITQSRKIEPIHFIMASLPIGAASGSAPPRVPANAAGNRSDIAWKHGVSIDGGTRKIKCNYCEKVVIGGVYRLKHHLACTQKDVGACTAVPDDAKKQMWDIVKHLQEKLFKKTDEEVLKETEKAEGKWPAEETAANLFKKRGVSSQTTINTIFKLNSREEACQEIASFFYNNAIAFNVAKSDEFQKMLEMVARHGKGFKPPSYYQIRTKYLKKQVEITQKTIEEHKLIWKKVGCSI